MLNISFMRLQLALRPRLATAPRLAKGLRKQKKQFPCPNAAAMSSPSWDGSHASASDVGRDRALVAPIVLLSDKNDSQRRHDLDLPNSCHPARVSASTLGGGTEIKHVAQCCATHSRAPGTQMLTKKGRTVRCVPNIQY